LEIEARGVRARPGASPVIVLRMEDEATDIAAIILIHFEKILSEKISEKYLKLS
jgi:hypothetical protein